MNFLFLWFWFVEIKKMCFRLYPKIIPNIIGCCLGEEERTRLGCCNYVAEWIWKIIIFIIGIPVFIIWHIVYIFSLGFCCDPNPGSICKKCCEENLNGEDFDWDSSDEECNETGFAGCYCGCCYGCTKTCCCCFMKKEKYPKFENNV